jgi:hypothetical protein
VLWIIGGHLPQAQNIPMNTTNPERLSVVPLAVVHHFTYFPTSTLSSDGVKKSRPDHQTNASTVSAQTIDAPNAFFFSGDRIEKVEGQ